MILYLGLISFYLKRNLTKASFLSHFTESLCLNNVYQMVIIIFKTL